MKRSKDLWLLIALFIALILGAYFFFSQKPSSVSPISTSYNSGPKGVKAFYVLLGRLGYRTNRLTRPYTELPHNARMLIVVQPFAYSSGFSIDGKEEDLAHISAAEETALTKWIKQGGTAVFLSDRFSRVPAAFAKSCSLGKGSVYAYGSRNIITNKGMRNYKNAVKLIEFAERHAGRGGVIYFDEYHHGIRSSRSGGSAVSGQVKAALWVALCAALLLCYSRARRFGAVRDLPKADTVRPGFEFVESIGRLYERAGASALASEILCRSFKQELCSKFGVASDLPQERMLEHLRLSLSEETIERIGRVLAGCMPLAAGEKLPESELLNIAGEIHKLEKELGLARLRS